VKRCWRWHAARGGVASVVLLLLLLLTCRSLLLRLPSHPD
jgi:hypothetical protein